MSFDGLRMSGTLVPLAWFDMLTTAEPDDALLNKEVLEPHHVALPEGAPPWLTLLASSVKVCATYQGISRGSGVYLGKPKERTCH